MVRHDEGFFSAKDNLRLFWQSVVPKNPRAYLAVVHGYAEHFGRYQRFAEGLAAEGIAVFGLDYRGHGQADGRRGFCDRYQDVVDDVELLWNRMVAAAGDRKCFLFGHSNGGLLSILLMGRGPARLSGAVLSAPFLKLKLREPLPKVLAARVLSKVLPGIPLKGEITPSHLTADEEEQRRVLRDPLYFHIVMPRWYLEMRKATRQGWKLAPTLQYPTFVLTGGDDPVVSTPDGRRFFEVLASPDKKYKEYAGMRHEPLNERGRDEVQRDISAWLAAHL